MVYHGVERKRNGFWNELDEGVESITREERVVFVGEGNEGDEDAGLVSRNGTGKEKLLWIQQKEWKWLW